MNPSHLLDRRLSHVYTAYVVRRCVVAYTPASACVQLVGSKEPPRQKICSWKVRSVVYKVGSSLITRDAFEFDSSSLKQRSRKAMKATKDERLCS